MRNIGLRKKFFKGKLISDAVTAGQVHSNKVYAVSGRHSNKEIKRADGLITQNKGLALCIFTADCMSVFFAAKDKNAVGLVHAGREGLKSGILPKTVELFKNRIGIFPSELRVFFGPHIKKCCYEVGFDILADFNIKRKTNLDMQKIARKQLELSGVKRIFTDCPCTKCNESEFFSYRRNQSKKRIMSVIML